MRLRADTFEKIQRTERHLYLISDTFYAHQGEGYYCSDGHCQPSEITDHGHREGEKVECDTLFQVNAICWSIVRPREKQDGDGNVQEIGIGVLATRSIAVS